MAKKKLENMTSEERKELKMVFAPGCFDNFEGTQEELDELIEHIQEIIVSGEIFENSRAIDLEELLDSNDPEDADFAEHLLESFNKESRKLQ